MNDIHYTEKGTKRKETVIKGDGLYLVDSGAKYTNGGTTDATRTVAVGTPTEEQKDRFTRVLKGHIALADVTFPPKTPGTKLDSLARQFLWEVGLNYNHGTGHGVGSYLGVHEAPGTNFGNGLLVPIEEGMVLSNEPGFYKETIKKQEKSKGEKGYGIRIESLMSSIPSLRKGFLCFKTITLVPIDKRLIEVKMLTDKELLWLNNYHNTIFRMLSPYVNMTSFTYPWLVEATTPIDRDYEEGMLFIKRNPKNKEDIKKGLELIHKSAEREHITSQKSLANLYFFGYGDLLLQNKDAAFKWLSQVVEKENVDPEEIDNIALMYEYGWGTKLDKQKALALTLKAADPNGIGGGCASAQYRLGSWYKMGWMVKEDKKESDKWFKLAHNNQGDPISDDLLKKFTDHLSNYKSTVCAIWLAQFYETGQANLSNKEKVPELDKAIDYYHQALILGEPRAQEKIEWLKKHTQK